MSAEVVLNGRARPLRDVGGHVTLLEWVRAQGLTGSKEGCAEGECGACAVLVLRPDDPHGSAQRSRWTAINSCLVPAAAYDGQEVLTAEGLGRPGDLHPVQRELAERGGSQCGYCTPGFVCSMAAEFYRTDRAPVTDGHDAEHGPNGFDLHALSGNLCRCTGYRPIRDAAYALGGPEAEDPLRARLDRPGTAPAPGVHGSPAGDLVRPASLAEALELLRDHPEARVVAGSTDWGVEVNLRHSRVALTVAVDRLQELRGLTVTDKTAEIGAALTLSEVERGLAGRIPLLDELFPQFASRLIRNGATLGGNLATASPIGDAPPVLLALDAELVLASVAGERTVSLSDFFTGYRETLRGADELIVAVRIPLPTAPITAFHKIAKRRFDDISGIALAFALTVDDGPDHAVTQARIGLGGVAATPIRALDTEAALHGRPWTEDTVREVSTVLAREGTPIDDHRASAAYRRAMLGQALVRLYAEATP